MMFMQYVWLIPLIPALCFAIVGFFGNKMGHKMHEGGFLVIAGTAASFILALLVTLEYTGLIGEGGYYPDAYSYSIDWFSLGGYTITIGYYIDILSCLMMLFASFISTMIFTYSLGYMHDQGVRQRRYFAEVALFLTGMLGLAVSSTLLEMFIFWEVMGLCSYLLIGFWSFNHPEGDDKADNAASAAKKAFLVTRLGDVCLMGGLFVLFFAMDGHLEYSYVFNAHNLAAANQDMLFLAALLIFGGVIGKSAQFPLLDWLPDAMAGPTTVSALIHAATMVKAGVYLVARCYPLFILEPNMMLFVAVIGGFTAFFAATMAMNNMNIKKVLAYSTLSQLGYMFLSLGAGGYLMATSMHVDGGAVVIDNMHLFTAGALGYSAGCLHMVNHAFFKALLFLCSGSVIHANGTEDMRLMGGLLKLMPKTAITMLVGTLSIAGFPLFAGFFSKDLVLDVVFEVFEETADFAQVIFVILWVLGIVTAFMTAFYMFRLWFMTFMGNYRGGAHGHCHGESPANMTVPLMILAVFAFAAGFILFLGWEGVMTFRFQFGNFYVGGGEREIGLDVLIELFTNAKTYITIVLVFVAIGLAYLMYVKKSINPGKFNKNGQSALYRTISNRYYFPELYNQLSWKLGYGIAKGVDFFDKQVIDGSVNGLSNSVVGGGDLMSKAQSGNLHTYAAVVLGGVVVLFVAAVVLFAQLGGLF
ncbi:MAG: NADH-quinone oxidoreductase subunit L [archaeon]|nr:NADH-quinone oxidoreductase subunit L [archaeon]